MSDDICKHGWSRRFCEQCSQARIIASLKGPGDKGMLANPPDDLVERVGRELARTGYAFAGIDLTDPYTADADYWNSQARAAIAALNAWPGVTTTSWFENGIRKAVLNIPLPQEARDE
jgi:hypothetical protein